MANIVTIRPKPGSRKFKAMQGMHNKQVVDGGQGKVEKSAEYKGERFPKSRQMFRPLWSFTKRMWLLDGFDKNSEELNAIVKACKLKYKKNHPNAGRWIEDADIFDFDDAFFTHEKMRLLAKEGEFILDKERPMDQILLASLLKNPQFQTGSENNPILSGRVKYVVVDRNIDKAHKKEVRDKKLEAGTLYQGLTDAKKAKIALTLELIPTEIIERDIIDDVLYSYATDNKTLAKDSPTGEKMTKQEFFIQLCKMEADAFMLDYEIAKAKELGFLKRNEQGYLLFGNPVGRTKQQIKQYFSDLDNQDLLYRLKTEIDDNK